MNTGVSDDAPHRAGVWVGWGQELAALMMSSATASGCERYTEWLAATSVVVVRARSAIIRCAGGGIIRSSVVTRYQPGLVCQAAWQTAPLSASSP